jgi:hypothetical protein
MCSRPSHTSAKRLQRPKSKRSQRYVVDIKTGEKIDVITDGYYDPEANDLTPDGRIDTAS